MPRRNRKVKPRKKGYRRFLSAPKKRQRPDRVSSFSSDPARLRNVMPTAYEDDCSSNAFDDSSCHSRAGSEPGIEADYVFHGFDEPPLRQGLRILSVFDGIGTGRLALEKLGIPIEKYYSCEVDDNALKVLQYHYHDTITMLGCVTQLKDEKLEQLSRVDLLLGGSPCSDLSLCNPRRKGLHGENSSGTLFFEFARILKYLLQSSKNSGHKFYFLFENTFAMEISTKNEISRVLGCKPIIRCASEYVPMCRKRLWWGSVPNLYEPHKPSHCGSTLQDYLMPYRTAAVKVLPTITSTRHSQCSGRKK